MKKVLAPHFTQKVIEAMSGGAFSLMMDESNDKTDESCIILVRLLDPQIGEVRTRFLDMILVQLPSLEGVINKKTGSALITQCPSCLIPPMS